MLRYSGGVSIMHTIKKIGSIPVMPAACVPVVMVLNTIVLLLAACSAGKEMPTRVPTAAAPITQEELSMAPTPTPLPASITIDLPIDGLVIDLGQPVQFSISASDPLGVRMVGLTANGQNIGTVDAVEQTTLEVNQTWTPNYPGTHEVIVSLTGRTGQVLSAEPISIRVIDRELLARYAPIWANVEGNVTEMRGLAKIEPIEPSLLSSSELKQRLQAQLFYSEEDAHRDVLVFSVFDFMSRDFDLYQLTHRYIGENIAGFYDPATEEFVVLSEDKEVDALEQWIYAHEFVHALQDQHFQLELITDTSLGDEANLAIRALAEGEAELLQEFYIEQGFFSQEELVDIFNLSSRMLSTEVPYMPPVLVNSFLFPYTTGRDFARSIYEQSGWDGLNNTWDNLPGSTEHIIHPDRYLAGDTPQVVALPPLTDTLGLDWTRLEEATLGEFLLREYLGQQLDEASVDTAATGWGGDQYAVYWQEETNALLMVLRLVWDTPVDGDQFSTAFANFAANTHGTLDRTEVEGGTCWKAIDVLCLYRFGADSIVIRAPNLETSATVAEAIR